MRGKQSAGMLMPRPDQGMAVVIPGSAPGPPGRLGMVAEEEAWHRPHDHFAWQFHAIPLVLQLVSKVTQTSKRPDPHISPTVH